MENRIKTKYDIIIDFINKYPDTFDDSEIRYLLNYTKRGKKDGVMVPDLVREVYDELGLLDNNDNIYLGFIDLLSDKFNYKERNITEIGGGIFPRLAKRISTKQTTGKITVYDPRLNSLENENNSFKLVREKFYGHSNIQDTDLLLGFMPCEATYNIIVAAARNKVDFMIALCEGGPHGDIYDYFESDNDWLGTMIYMAERAIEDNNLGTLEKTYLKEYHNPYPVIYNKRK